MTMSPEEAAAIALAFAALDRESHDVLDRGKNDGGGDPSGRPRRTWSDLARREALMLDADL